MTLYIDNPEKRNYHNDHIRSIFDRICEAYLTFKDEPDLLRQAYQPLAEELFEHVPVIFIDSFNFRFSGQEGGDYVFHRMGFQRQQGEPSLLTAVDEFRNWIKPLYTGGTPTKREDYFAKDDHNYPLPPTPKELKSSN